MKSIARADIDPSDKTLEAMVKDLQYCAEQWIRALGFESGWNFTTFEEHYSLDKPYDVPVVLILLYSDETIDQAIEREWDSFVADVLDNTAFESNAI